MLKVVMAGHDMEVNGPRCPRDQTRKKAKCGLLLVVGKKKKKQMNSFSFVKRVSTPMKVVEMQDLTFL